MARLTDEIAEAEHTMRELYCEINDAVIAKRQLDESRTLKGRAFNVIGHAMSAWCLYKMVMAAANIVWKRTATIDPVSRGIEIALHWCGAGLRVCLQRG
jgi:hypothetical protein